MTRTAEELAEVAVPRFADFVTVDLLESVVPARGTARPAVVPDPRRDAPGRPPVGPRGLPEAALALGETGDLPGLLTSRPAALATGRPVLAQVGRTERLSRWLAAEPRTGPPGLEDFGIHSMLAVPLRGPRHHPRRGGLLPPPAARSRSTRTTCCSPRRSPPGPPSASTTPAATPASAPPRSPCSAACCPAAPARSRPPSRSPPAICPPARAGVGGDWFDVIPLSGARVALVVGDVVGHGIHASATMGRLRTAVRTLADVDLPPGRAAHPPRRPGHPPRPPRRAPAGRATPSAGEHRRHLPVRGLRPGLPALHPGPRRPPAARRASRPDGTHRVPRPAGRPAAGPRRPALRGHRGRTARGQPARPLHRRPDRGPRPRHRRRHSTALRRGSGRPRRRPWTTLCDTVLKALLPDRPDRRRRPAAGPHPGPGRRPGRHLGPARRPGAVVADARKQAARPAGRLGPGRGVASSPSWSSANWSPTPSGYGAAPIQLRLIRDRTPDLRGLRRQQHRPAPAPGPHLRRGRPRPAPGRPAHPALGHPPDPQRQDHLGRVRPRRTLTRSESHGLGGSSTVAGPKQSRVEAFWGSGGNARRDQETATTRTAASATAGRRHETTTVAARPPQHGVAGQAEFVRQA